MKAGDKGVVKNDPYKSGKQYFAGDKKNGVKQSYSQAFLCFSQAITHDPCKFNKDAFLLFLLGREP